MEVKIVDADSHVLEPSDLWEENLEPEFRDRAIRLGKDEGGLESFYINGKKSLMLRDGTLGTVAAVGQSHKEMRERFLKAGVIGYEEGRAIASGSKDPDERIRVMDSENTDITFLYPTVGLSWEVLCEDPELSAACCRVYNDWLADFCNAHPERLKGISHVPMIDAAEAAKELDRAAAKGLKGVFFTIWPPSERTFGDKYYDPLWSVALDAKIGVSLHVFNSSKTVTSHQRPDYFAEPLFEDWTSGVMFNVDVIKAYTTVVAGGTMDRFPDLNFVMLEVGCGWVPYWLDRMDSAYEAAPWNAPMKLKPSEYFFRQCFVTMEPEERTVAATAGLIGSDKILWASDYPHSEGHVGTVAEVKEKIAPLSEEDQANILGNNAFRLYDIG
jgi:predicted TIM-barrel fold metal-dependent hydrolase